MSLFKTKGYSKWKLVKTVYWDGKKKSEENIIKSIKNLFKLKKENKASKHEIIRNITTPFKQGDHYFLNQ